MSSLFPRIPIDTTDRFDIILLAGGGIDQYPLEIHGLVMVVARHKQLPSVVKVDHGLGRVVEDQDDDRQGIPSGSRSKAWLLP